MDPTNIKDHVLHRLRQRVAGLDVGTRLPGIHALARELGTSNVTMRLVMQQLAVEGLIDTRPRSGSYVALRQTRPATGDRPVALVCVHDILQPRASRHLLFVLGELRAKLEAMDMPCRLFIGTRKTWAMPVDQQAVPPDPPRAEFVAALGSGELAGVISVANPALGQWVPLARQTGVPVIAQGVSAFVHTAIQAAIHHAVGHMAAAGRTRIGLLSWFDPAPEVPAEHRSPNFRAMFDQAMRDHGLRPEPAWIAGQFHPTRPYAGADALREVWTARREKPDGLIITDDVLARTALPALGRLGVAPQRLDVVCHANQDDPLVAPMPIAWMRAPRGPMCDALIRLLLEAQQGRPATTHVHTPMEWIDADTRSDAPADRELMDLPPADGLPLGTVNASARTP